jgi:hypothetical protein
MWIENLLPRFIDVNDFLSNDIIAMEIIGQTLK